MLVIEHATAYGTSIVEARRPTEAEAAKVAEWYRPRYLVSTGRVNEPLLSLRLEDIATRIERRADGEFMGCNNSAWILTEEDAAYFRSLNQERLAAKEREATAERNAEQAARDAAFAEARRTGERMRLSCDMVACDGSAPDCSFDYLTIWASPDGTTTTTRRHCY